MTPTPPNFSGETYNPFSSSDNSYNPGSSITTMSSFGNGLSSNAQGVIGGLGAGVLGGLGNLFGQTPAGSTTKTSSNTSTTPTYSSAVLPLYNQLLSKYMDAASGKSSDQFFKGYQSQGQQGINATSAGGSDNIARIAAQHGLEYSPSTGTAMIQQELARQSQQTGFNNNIPLLQHQDQVQQLQNAGNFFSGLPVGTTGTSNGTSDVTQKPQGNFLSGLLGGVAKALPSLLAFA